MEQEPLVRSFCNFPKKHVLNLGKCLLSCVLKAQIWLKRAHSSPVFQSSIFRTVFRQQSLFSFPLIGVLDHQQFLMFVKPTTIISTLKRENGGQNLILIYIHFKLFSGRGSMGTTSFKKQFPEKTTAGKLNFCWNHTEALLESDSVLRVTPDFKLCSCPDGFLARVHYFW